MKHIAHLLLPVLLLTALIPFGSLTLIAEARNVQAQATATHPDGADCDHDGGHSPGDDLCTPTPTRVPVTPTPAACVVERGNFNRVPVGSSVEGMGAVAPDVNISSRYSAVHVQANASPEVYVAAPNQSTVNGGLRAVQDAFGDVEAHLHRLAAHFTFTFAQGLTITDFRLHMLDFGDWNPLLQTRHIVTVSAFNASNRLVDQQVLSYTTPPDNLPTSSNKYGDLYINGDALTAPVGMPGNWFWHVSGKGITRVTLDVVAGPDPNFALDGLFVKFSCR